VHGAHPLSPEAAAHAAACSPYGAGSQGGGFVAGQHNGGGDDGMGRALHTRSLSAGDLPAPPQQRAPPRAPQAAPPALLPPLMWPE
jgi:hypothetical protein